MDSKTILNALRDRHHDAVFVKECKDGASQSRSNFSRMDAWVMEKSWTRPRTVVYEIKISRSDFLNDKKWHAYLPFGNEFYFATPKGLIKPEELSAECGLMELTGTRFRTVKKAPWRDVVIPEAVYRYILMCRARISDEKPGHAESNESWRREELRRWVEEKNSDKELGYAVSRKIRLFVDAVKFENRTLAEANRGLQDIKDFLIENRIMRDNKIVPWDWRQRLESLNGLIPDHLVFEMESAAKKIQKAVDEIRRLKTNR